jgi:hypothetical protein
LAVGEFDFFSRAPQTAGAVQRAPPLVQTLLLDRQTANFSILVLMDGRWMDASPGRVYMPHFSQVSRSMSIINILL